MCVVLQMKETKTAKGSPECPTLLHYVARVLIRTNPSLTLFIEEMRSVESAARSEWQVHPTFLHQSYVVPQSLSQRYSKMCSL